MRPIFIVRETFEIWDEESIEIGDTDNKGYNFIDQPFELRELIDYIKDNGYIQPSCYPIKRLKNVEGPCRVWLSTVDRFLKYSTGEEEFRSLHFKGLSCHNFYRICVLAGIIK